MKFRRLTIWTFMFMMSGLVCLLNPNEGYSEGSIYKRNWSTNFLKQFTRQNIKRQNKKLYSQKTKKNKTSSSGSNIKFRLITHNVAIGEGGFQPRIAGVSGYLIWNNFGIGQTEMVYYYNNYDSENSIRFDLRNTTNDLSYTFGKDYNLTLGLGTISNGKGNIVTNSRTYETTSVKGNHYFSIFGMELGYFELLFGYRRLQFEYKDFKRDSLGTTVILDTVYKISGGYKIFGIGFSF